MRLRREICEARLSNADLCRDVSWSNEGRERRTEIENAMILGRSAATAVSPHRMISPYLSARRMETKSDP